MNINYKKTAIEEAEDMAEVYNKAFYSDYINYGICPGYGHSVEGMKESIVKNIKYSILDENVLIGAISVSGDDDNYYLGCLCIVPDYQGMGIGTEAMNSWKKS